jgi:cytochrome c oxidase subunit II
MGLVLLVVIWLITFISAYFFIAKTWWLPVGASAAAAGIDHHFTTTYILMGIVFVAAQVILGLFAWQYRSRGSATPQAHYTHGNNRLEIIWTVLTFILFVGLNFMSSSIWASERFRPAASDAVQVEVTGMQFQWYFRYPGPDGKFGATKPELQDASAGGEGAIGLDPSDPASKDDFVTGTMYVPVNREVEVILRAEDVIHSFFVPAMRFKQDAVPGLAIHVHFTPIATGDYEIACSQLCGLGHYKMHGTLRVVSQQDFDKWVAVQEAGKQ